MVPAPCPLVTGAWALADTVGGYGFIAAFVGGLVIGPTVERVGDRLIRFTEVEGQVLNLSVFFIFGVFAFGVIQPLSLRVVLYAVLSLTLIRMLPVAVSLIGTRLSGLSMLFMGWFGPRGLASLVLGLIVLAEAPLLAGRGLIEQVVALTVLLSVLLHGVSAAPLATAYAHQVEKMAPMRRRTKERSSHRPAGAPYQPTVQSKRMRINDMSSPNGRKKLNETRET
jgi:sodium/hydrogen antiporter